MGNILCDERIIIAGLEALIEHCYGEIKSEEDSWERSYAHGSITPNPGHSSFIQKQYGEVSRLEREIREILEKSADKSLKKEYRRYLPWTKTKIVFGTAFIAGIVYMFYESLK